MSVLISVVFLVLKQIGWTPSIALLMKHAALPLQIPFFLMKDLPNCQLIKGPVMVIVIKHLIISLISH